MTDPASVTVRVTEIFRSVQGESTFAGLPCVFVRLSGCNLRCRYCDTTYAYEPGRLMTAAEIVARVESLGGGLVEVTGGEPLHQDGTPALLEYLVAQGRTVLLETNGSRLLPQDRDYHVIMDLKCPASGETAKIEWANIERLQPGDELKFVICDRRDFDWAVDTIRERDLGKLALPLLFSPVLGTLEPRDLAAWILESGLDVRLQLQLHKLIWPDTPRGV